MSAQSRSLSALARRVRDSSVFQMAVIVVILVGAVVVGLETYPVLMERYGGFLKGLDRIIVYLFTLEALIKIVAEGKRPWRYFQNGWNVFDFVIVVASYLPAIGTAAMVVRLLRLLRVLRLISVLPRLQFLLAVMFRTVPSMGYVGILLSLLFYVYAVTGILLFRENDPFHFGDLKTALVTLFRVVTLEDWTDVMYIQMYGSDVYPFPGYEKVAETVTPTAYGWGAAIYFSSFVVFGALVVLNLFIGVIVNGINEIHASDQPPPPDQETMDRLYRVLERLESRLDVQEGSQSGTQDGQKQSDTG